MDNLNTIDHKLNIQDKINRIDKYYQFSDENTNFNTEEMKKWYDVLETILYQIDQQFNLLCLSNKSSDIKDYLSTIRCELMDNFASGDLFRKYKYNSRAGINKTTIGTNFQSIKTNESGLVFYSDYFELNLVLIDRTNKNYFHIKEPVPEQHYLMINLDEKEFIPPLSLGSYLLKKEELMNHLNNFTEVNKLVDITDTIDSNIKNINNIYKRDVDKAEKKITDFKVVELQNIAKVNNIPILNPTGKKKTKAQLFGELKGKL